MRRKTTPAPGIWGLTLLALGTSAPSAALHSVFVAVPGHSEEALTWCGPAVAEMAMEGYPSSACDETQADISAEIVLHRSEAVWDTDPEGMRATLEALCPPPAGGWSIFSRTDAADLMFSVASWMTRNGFPVPALLSTTAHNSYTPHEEHWVLIKGVITDVDPTTASTVSLEHVWITDPSPATLGDPPLERFLSGSAWYAELQAVTKAGSSYHGEFVAVIEPPRVKGLARAEPRVLRGRVLPPGEVMARARRRLDELEILRELEPFAELHRAKALDPLLVDAPYGGYYLVPYALDGETVGHALLINAYDGTLLEAGAFAPVRYLGEKEAVETSLERLGIRRPRSVTARLVSDPRAGAASRYHPVWRVEVDGQVVGVRHDGTVRTWPVERERQRLSPRSAPGPRRRGR